MEILKNVQIIFRLLSEHRKIALFVTVVVFTILNVFFNIFITNKYSSKVKQNTNKKKKVFNIFKG